MSKRAIPHAVSGQPYVVYMAECQDCLTEMEGLLRPIKGEYTAAVFCSALLALLMRSVATWKQTSKARAMTYVRQWATNWEDSFHD